MIRQLVRHAAAMRTLPMQLFNRFLFRAEIASVLHAASSLQLELHILPRSAARETCLHQCAALQDPSCKIRALTHVLLVAAGATALSLDLSLIHI